MYVSYEYKLQIFIYVCVYCSCRNKTQDQHNKLDVEFNARKWLHLESVHDPKHKLFNYIYFNKLQ
jgi:hypothetical protein